MMICYIDIVRVRADGQGTFIQFRNIRTILFGYLIEDFGILKIKRRVLNK